MDTEAFAERLFGSFLGGLDMLTITLGDQLGLYDALHHRGPLTAGELAETAGIAPRYAREWLEQQTVAGILSVDDAELSADERRFAVPAEHVPVLVDQDSLMYFRPFLTAVAGAAVQLPALLDAYRTGGGVSWQQFGDLVRNAQGQGNRPLFLQVLGQEWLPSLPDIHRRLAAGGRVADIGCGEGWSAIGMALAYPDIRVDGYDIDEASVEAANAHAEAYGVGERVTVHCVDAGHGAADREEGYDLVTAFECVHDMGDPVSVLAQMREMAAPNGVVVVVDERVPEKFTGAGDPMERMFYGFSTLICLPDGMSHEGSVGTGTVMRPDVLRGYAREAGFSDIDVLPIEHEAFRVYQLVS
jgi:SAM-dependent methyltransferase